jgi:hypothetical protein
MEDVGIHILLPFDIGILPFLVCCFEPTYRTQSAQALTERPGRNDCSNVVMIINSCEWNTFFIASSLESNQGDRTSL